MESAVSAADANRNFSQLLRDVRGAVSYVVTVHGRPVARIVPYEPANAARDAARAALLKRLRNEPVTDIGPWRRDELYER